MKIGKRASALARNACATMLAAMLAVTMLPSAALADTSTDGGGFSVTEPEVGSASNTAEGAQGAGTAESDEDLEQPNSEAEGASEGTASEEADTGMPDEDVAQDGAASATPAESLAGSGYINQVQPLEVVAQAESTRSYFLAQTLESTRTVPVLSAKLPIDTSMVGEAAMGAENDGDGAEDEGGDGSDEPDPAVAPIIAAESTVVGSFVYRGITYAVEPGGESVAIVAADYAQLPADFVAAQTIVLPSQVSPDNIDTYSVTRIADGAFASLTAAVAEANMPIIEANAPDGLADTSVADENDASVEMSSLDIISTAVALTEDSSAARVVSNGAEEGALDGTDPLAANENERNGEETDEVDADAEATAADATAGALEPSVGITAITIPASITDIEQDAFIGFETLQYVIVSADNPEYSMYDGCLCDKPQTNLLLIPEGRLGAVRVPSTATTIPEDVSSHCAHLTSFVVEPGSAASQLLAENDFYNANGEKVEVVDSEAAPEPQVVADYSGTIEAQMGEIIETTVLFGEDYISQKSFLVASDDLGKDTSMIQCREDAAVVCISAAEAGQPAYNVVSITVEQPVASLLSVEETQKLAADETTTTGTTIGTDGCYGYDYTNKKLMVYGGVASASSYTMLNSGTTGFSGRVSWTGSNTTEPDEGAVVTVKVTSYVPKGNNCAVIEGLYGISTRAWKDASGKFIANKDKKLVGFRDATTGDYIALESIYSKSGFSFSFVMPASGCTISDAGMTWSANVSLQPVTETVTNNVISYFSVEGGYLKSEGTGARTQVDGTDNTLYFTTYSEIGSALMLPVSTPVHETDADGTNYVPAGWYDTSGGHAPVTATSACQGKTYTIKWEKRAGTWTLKNAKVTIYGGVSAGDSFLMMNTVTGFDGTISWTGTNTGGPQEKDTVTVTCSRYVPDTKNCAVIEGLFGISALKWKGENGKFIADKDNQLIGFRDSGTGSFLSLNSLFDGNGFTFSFIMPSSDSCTISETKISWIKNVTLKPVTKQVTNKILTYFKAYPGHLTNPATMASTQEESSLAFATYSDIGSALALPTSTVERENGDVFVGWKNEKTNAAPPLKAAAADNGQTYISTWQTRGGFRDYTNAKLQVFPKMNGGTTSYTMLATTAGFSGRISWTGSNSSAPQEGDIVTVKVTKYVPKGNNCAVKEGLLGMAIKPWGIASATNRLVGFRDCNTNSYISLDSIFDGNGFSFYFKMPATDTCTIDEKGLVWKTATASLVPVTEQVSDMIVTYYHLTPGHFELPATGAATQNDQFGVEGGTVDLRFATYSKKGEPLVRPSCVPVCTDKIFTGWFTSPTSTVVAPSIATDDIQGSTFHAQWGDKATQLYHFSFNANDSAATGEMTNWSVPYPNKFTLPQATFVKAGYTVTSWNTQANGSGTTYNADTEYTARAANSTTNLFAKWTQDTYKLAFTMNGGSFASSYTKPTEYKYGTGSYSIPNPTRTGYTFQGWTGPGLSSATKNLTIDWSTDDKLGKRTAGTATYTRTYVATWKANTYTVKFALNGGTATSNTQTADKTATFGSTMPVISTGVPTRTGYTFKGWYDNATWNATGATQYYTAACVSPSTVKWNKASNTTLYAGWEANDQTITWKANGGTISGSSSATTIQKFGSTITRPSSNPTWRGYRFDGWYTAQTGGTQVGVTGGKTTVDSINPIYFARWTKVDGTIVLNAVASTDAEHAEAKFTNDQVSAYNTAHPNGPVARYVSDKRIELTYSATTAAFSMLDANLKPTLRGSTFKAWSPAVTSFDPATTPTWNTTGTAKETYAQKEYTANWTTNGYGITYKDMNGKDLDGWSTVGNVELPSSFTVLTTDRALPPMSKRGYTWVGWTCKDKDGNAIAIDEDEPAIPDVTKDITLVANFTVNQYPISVILDGGTQTGWHDGGFTSTYDNPVLALPTNDDKLKKSGHVFQYFKAYKTGSDEAVTVMGQDVSGAYTVPVTELLPGESYKVLGLGSGNGIYDVSSIKAVWATRLAVDVPENVPLSIVADTANDTLRFRDGRAAYAGETEDEFAPMTFTSFTTTPVAIVKVADDMNDAKASERTALLDRVFPGGHDSILMAISHDKSLARHRLAFRGATSLPSGSGYLEGLAIGKPTDPENGASATFWLGMDFGGRKAADLASGLSGDIAKLYYTVALMNDDGTALATAGETLPAYDDLGILWTAPSESGASA